MIDLSTQKETATKAAKDVSDSTVEYAGKAKDIGMSSAKSATDSANDYLDKTLELGLTAADAAVEAIKLLMEQAMTFTDRGFEKVSDVQVGQKNVGERVQATVDSVEEKIDVDQLQDQVAKLREQMEHVLISWKDSFRPSSTVTEVVAEEKVPAKKAVTKQTPAKKATVKRTTTKKTAPKKTSTAKKATAKKAPATKATAKK
jgi:DNA-binding protein HU-beta